MTGASPLRREHFAISRASEYFRAEELQAQTGQPVSAFWHVALKELLDNALDAAESASRAPEIRVSFSRCEAGLHLAVTDNGCGIPASLVASITDFATRTSDKVAYVAPTRGAQGNALKTLMGISVALGADPGRMVIESQGSRHELTARITPSGSVQPTHTVASTTTAGTRVELRIPGGPEMDWEPERWLADYAVANPHAAIQIREFEAGGMLAQSDRAGIEDLSFPPSAPEGWRKFQPTDLTAAQWYSLDEFARLLHLKAERNPALPLRDFVQEFRGQSRRWREVCNAVPAQTVGESVALDPVHTDVLHNALMCAPAPSPEVLGRVRAEHFRAHFDRLYGIQRFWYRHKAVEIDGRPFVVEVAIAETVEAGRNVWGVNYSVPFSDPAAGAFFSNGGAAAHGLNSLLRECGVFSDDYRGYPLRFCAAVHLIMPRLPSLDRGKSRLALSEGQRAVIAETVVRAAKEPRQDHDRWLKQQYRAVNARSERKAFGDLTTKREAVESILLDVYKEATEGEALYITARDLYYAIRPRYNAMGVRPSKKNGELTTDLDFNYFSQTILPNFRANRHPLEMVDYKARGVLYNPHDEIETPIGDKELRDFEFPLWTFNKLLFIEKEGIWTTMKQMGGREFAKRWDMAIVCSEGFSTEAVRKLMARAQSDAGYQVFVFHDADPAGYNIARTLAEETRRMPGHAIKVFDLGLNLEGAIEAGYQDETFTRKKALPSTLKLTEFERRLFTGDEYTIGYDKREWRDCRRVEINAIPPRERIPYLEARLAEIPDLLPKVQPPAEVLHAQALDLCRDRLKDRVISAVKRRLDLDAIVAEALQALGTPWSFAGEPLARLTRLSLAADPEQSWRAVLNVAVDRRLQKTVTDDAIEEAVADAVASEARSE